MNRTSQRKWLPGIGARMVRPASAVRPGSVPGTTNSYNSSKEVMAITNSNGSGIVLTRDTNTGNVTNRELSHLGVSDSFAYNDAGWLTDEQRAGWHSAYTYRDDGVRASHALNGRTATFVCSDAGVVQEVRNAVLGVKLQAPLEAADANTYVVGGAGGYTSIEAAVMGIYSNLDTNVFTATQVVLVRLTPYTNDVCISATLGALQPATNFPLIIRSARGDPVTLAGRVELTEIPNVRWQGFYLTKTNSSGAIWVHDASGAALAACVVQADCLISNCVAAQVIGNTFDYRTGGREVTVTDCVGVILRDNIYLNDGSSGGVALDAQATNSGWNCYFPSNALVPVETNSLYVDPQVATNGDYSLMAYASPARNSGVAVAGYSADLYGQFRHLATPSLGAVEYHIETTTRDDAGRISQRIVDGREYDYAYEALGHLTTYTDSQNPSNNATYQYDYLGRRVKMTVGSAVWRFVYDNDDVVAEYEDSDGDGNIDRKRVYWLLPEIDQRIGFVEMGNGQTNLYYYLTDQVGSVLQIVDSGGTVVNQYDYDAWGNVRWGSTGTFEGVENRFLFQGREWDSNAGHYYWRNRICFPEHGGFPEPDMNLANGIIGEPNGVGNYLFCDNDPLVETDALGLGFITALETSSKIARRNWYKYMRRELVKRNMGELLRVHHMVGSEFWKDPTLGPWLKGLGIKEHSVINMVALPTKAGRAAGKMRRLEKGSLHLGRHLSEYVEETVAPKLRDVQRRQLAGDISEEAARVAIANIQKELRTGLKKGEIRLHKEELDALSAGALSVGGLVVISLPEEELEDIALGRMTGEDNAQPESMIDEAIDIGTDFTPYVGEVKWAVDILGGAYEKTGEVIERYIQQGDASKETSNWQMRQSAQDLIFQP